MYVVRFSLAQAVIVVNLIGLTLSLLACFVLLSAETLKSLHTGRWTLIRMRIQDSQSASRCLEEDFPLSSVLRARRAPVDRVGNYCKTLCE